tara:strand:+ start:288 stop:500 length:213 start_codon:yes stop_codon:yes gene_type:complete
MRHRFIRSPNPALFPGGVALGAHDTPIVLGGQIIELVRARWADAVREMDLRNAIELAESHPSKQPEPQQR